MALLVVGGVAGAAVLAFVLLPMFLGGAPAGGRRARGAVAAEPADDGARAIDALREIEFDRETGKLSDADYAALKATYTASALDELRRDDAGGGRGRGGSSSAPAAQWSCPECGPRPESDAVFCSNCARYLPGVCEGCGAAVAEPAARYCAGCGNRLVA